jgi:hypothetical protein
VRDFSGSDPFGIRALTPAEFLAELEKKDECPEYQAAEFLA